MGIICWKYRIHMTSSNTNYHKLPRIIINNIFVELALNNIFVELTLYYLFLSSTHGTRQFHMWNSFFDPLGKKERRERSGAQLSTSRRISIDLSSGKCGTCRR